MANIRKMQSKNPPTVSGVTINTVIAPNGPGSLIVVWVGVSDLSAFTFTFSDDAAVPHTWTQLTGSPIVGSVAKGYAFYTISHTAAPFTITFTKSGGSVFMNLLLDEFVGVDVSTPHDVSAVSSGTGAAPGTITSTSLTPAVDRSLIWSAVNDSVTGPGTNFTKGADDAAQDITEWRVLDDKTAGAATTATYPTTAGGAYTMAVAVFRPAPGPTANARLSATRPAAFRPGLAR